MSYVQPHDSGRRLTGFVFVVLLHVVLIYALINGLARKIVQVVSEPLETKIIEEVKPPPDKPPPPPPPKLAPPPPPYIPPPEVQVQLPPSVQQHAITAVTSVKPPPAPVRPHVPNRAAAIVNASACDKPEYPPASLRAQETGIVTLRFLIDVDGRVLESKVERSSGSRRLDEAARKALGLCKFQPATVDGKPEKSWAPIQYEWRIE
ncbi:MAG: energy transducer TonB [Betaproteobacteria bacterium]|nr:energy transducer TonB [Betaproteobacteria bacterium]